MLEMEIIIKGPKGSGKSILLGEIVREFLQKNPEFKNLRIEDDGCQVLQIVHSLVDSPKERLTSVVIRTEEITIK